MIKRLHIYFKEMYPFFTRMVLGFILFLEIYFMIVLNMTESEPNFVGFKLSNLDIPEVLVGGFTIFCFLMFLRIADDFKDYELDCKLFAHRPLPSGRVTKKDLKICLAFFTTLVVILNIVFMHDKNLLFFFILYFYGFLMSKWFFHKSKIQPSLPLALVTHNPVQMFINLYIISYTLASYDINFLTVNWEMKIKIVLALLTLYFPALIWEIARKIKAPKDENEYVTYSKLFGYKKATKFIMILTIVDIITNFILVWSLNKISVVVLFIIVSWMTVQFVKFMKDPTKFKIVTKVEQYTYVQESIMLLTVACYLMIGAI